MWGSQKCAESYLFNINKSYSRYQTKMDEKHIYREEHIQRIDIKLALKNGKKSIIKLTTVLRLTEIFRSIKFVTDQSLIFNNRQKLWHLKKTKTYCEGAFSGKTSVCEPLLTLLHSILLLPVIRRLLLKSSTSYPQSYPQFRIMAASFTSL